MAIPEWGMSRDLTAIKSHGLLYISQTTGALSGRMAHSAPPPSLISQSICRFRALIADDVNPFSP